MGISSDYPQIPDWVEKPEGYQAGSVVKYKGNIFRAAFWASEPGVGDANSNGWRFFDELYDRTPHQRTERAKIIAYIPTWRRQEGFDYAKGEMFQYITHGLISFLTFSETRLGEFDGASVDEVLSVLPDVVRTGRAHGTKIMVAIGGANDYGFLNLMTAAGNNPGLPQLDQAVAAIAAFVDVHRLDGVDLDLECWWGKPGDADQGGRAKADGPHPAGRALVQFAKKLKEAMPGKLVSAATFGTSWYGNNYDAALADHVDWLSIMTYDLTGSWDKSPVGPHTALHSIRPESTSSIRQSDVYLESYAGEQQGPWPGGGPENNPILSVEDTLWYWTNPMFVNWQGEGQNFPRNKVAAGVPIYGYDFAHGKEPDDVTGLVPSGYKAVRYKDILADFPDANTARDAHIAVPGSTPRPPLAEPLPPGDYPYANNIYFETPDTAVAKLNFLKDVGAHGVIIWELSNDVWDDNKSIIKALYRASGNPVIPPALPSEDPIKELPGQYLWDSTGFLGGSESDYQFKDDGIIRDGVRQYSARLWNVPDGEDWVNAAKRAPAVIKRQYFNRPTRIVDKGALGLWGEFDVFEDSNVPDWNWGHMKAEGGAPEGYTRHSARLWGLPTTGGDWVGSSEKTPALVAGQYFDKPSAYDDQGIGGFWGFFDVKNGGDGVPIRVGHAIGDNGCFYCTMSSVPPPGGNVTWQHLMSTMTVEPDTPYLYAALTRDTDSTDFPDGVVMTIKDPNGNYYDHEVREDNLTVVMHGSSVRCLVVKDPQPGEYTMLMSAPSGAQYHCECNAVPSADYYDTMVKTREKLGFTGLEPRGLGEALAFVGLAAVAGVVGVVTLTLPVVGLIGLVAGGLALVDFSGTPHSNAQSMAEISRILNKVTGDVKAAKDPLAALAVIGNYIWLLGRNISLPEVAVIVQQPQNLFRWLGVHAMVYKQVQHMTDPEEQNSVRHVYWQCVLKKRLGEQFAKAMGEAHERGRPGTDADNKADEKNNVIGLALADRVATEADCLTETKRMWAAGELAVRQDYEGDPT
jgi:GH18 family chitinase